MRPIKDSAVARSVQALRRLAHPFRAGSAA
jgi:hypothetical protein